jgi:hypothetical protein
MARSFYGIASLVLVILVLQCIDRVGPSSGAASFMKTPMLWLILSLFIAGIAMALQRKLQPRMQETKGHFTLKYVINVPVRLSAFRQWLMKQILVQV